MKIIVSALALVACSRASDASALANEIKALESASVSLETDLHLWTAVVVVGLVMEFGIIFHGFKEDMAAFRRGTIRSPERPPVVKFIIELLATLLITVGVFGELKVGIKSSSTQPSCAQRATSLRT